MPQKWDYYPTQLARENVWLFERQDAWQKYQKANEALLNHTESLEIPEWETWAVQELLQQEADELFAAWKNAADMHDKIMGIDRIMEIPF